MKLLYNENNAAVHYKDGVKKPFKSRVKRPGLKLYWRCSHHTLDAAIHWCRQRQSAPLVMEVGGVMLDHVARDYVRSMQARNCDPAHIANMVRVFKRAGEAGITQLDKQGVREKARDFITNLRVRGGKPASLKTRREYAIALLSLGKHAMLDTFGMMRNPFAGLEVVKLPEAERYVYPLQTIRHCLDSGREDMPGYWVFALGVLTGMRAEEIGQSCWKWFHWDSGWLVIPAVVAKSDSSRKIKIQPDLVRLLKPRAGVGEGRVVMPDNRRKRVNEAVLVCLQKFFDAVGVEPDTGKITHALRHSFASLLRATQLNIWDIMDQLGHKRAEQSQHYSQGSKYYAALVEQERWPIGKLCLLQEQVAEQPVVVMGL